jgi:hypothetical protein
MTDSTLLFPRLLSLLVLESLPPVRSLEGMKKEQMEHARKMPFAFGSRTSNLLTVGQKNLHKF